MGMTVTTLDRNNARFSLTGDCPHCSSKAVFMPMTSSHVNGNSVAAVLECQGCRKLILGMVLVQPSGLMVYHQHAPLGKPSEDVASEIPPAIAIDFREALRCRWIEAYNATGEMCRRALEGSCNEQGAPAGKKLVDKIDWLSDNGKITVALKDVAHKIRLGGNYGAHAPEDPLGAIPMTDEHADALIEFTRDYFQHVYVMPKRLEKYDFTKKGMSKPATP
jgi:hypothetical protein